MKVLIIGSRGLLGSFLSHKLKKKYNIFCSSRTNHSNFLKLKLDNIENTKKFFKKNSFDIIINTSGLVDVDKCDKNFLLAKKGNCETVKNLSKTLINLETSPHLIHFSTDQVYNNRISTKPNKEYNINLSNNYSKSKYLGELQLQNYKKKTILRTNFFGQRNGVKKISFSSYLIKNLKKKKYVKTPINIYFSPIHMEMISTTLEKIISKKVYGTFNLGSSTGISKYEFCKKVAKLNKLSIKYLTPFFSNFKIEKRPYGTIMNVNKIEKKLRIKLPTIDKSIKMLSK